MANNIEFIDTWGNTRQDLWPIPASKNLPEWYKKTESYSGPGGKILDRRIGSGSTNATIKKCNPVFDSITAGYLLLTPTDLNVRRKKDGSEWYEWPTQDIVGFHTTEQNPNYPGQEGRDYGYPKFIHQWIIKTPPGYSTYFMPPVHRKIPFKILEGFVDTDTYGDIVQLPFLLEKDFEGLIPAGTPMAQVIPIKRESWSLKVREATSKDKKRQKETYTALFSVFNNGYRNLFWRRKDYR